MGQCCSELIDVERRRAEKKIERERNCKIRPPPPKSYFDKNKNVNTDSNNVRRPKKYTHGGRRALQMSLI